jgi:hypothetical protein
LKTYLAYAHTGPELSKLFLGKYRAKNPDNVERRIRKEAHKYTGPIMIIEKGKE